ARGRGRARRMMRMAWLAAALIAAPPAAAGARAAPALDVRGAALGPRETRAALEPAVRAPGDSAALSGALGALVERLQEQGYWQARARGRWESRDRLSVAVEPGPRVRLASVTLRATSPADSMRIASALEVSPGGWSMPA